MNALIISNNNRNKIIFEVLAPILVGGMIYVLLRSKSLIMFKWFEFLGLNDIVNIGRASFETYIHNTPNWILYSLPDALWVYAFTTSLLMIWGNKWNIGKVWLLVPFVCGVIAEVLQYFEVIRGTFDSIDIIACLSAQILSIYMFNLNYDKP